MEYSSDISERLPTDAGNYYEAMMAKLERDPGLLADLRDEAEVSKTRRFFELQQLAVLTDPSDNFFATLRNIDIVRLV